MLYRSNWINVHIEGLLRYYSDSNLTWSWSFRMYFTRMLNWKLVFLLLKGKIALNTPENREPLKMPGPGNSPPVVPLWSGLRTPVIFYTHEYVPGEKKKSEMRPLWDLHF